MINTQKLPFDRACPVISVLGIPEIHKRNFVPQSRYIILVLYAGNVSESWENEVRPLRTSQPRTHYIDA